MSEEHARQGVRGRCAPELMDAHKFQLPVGLKLHEITMSYCIQ